MKKWLWLIVFLPTASWAAPTILPSTPTVTLGGTVQFAATETVTWSMYPGSLGSISAGGLYTAPSSLRARNVMAGVPLVPNDFIYNVDITSLPVDSNSATRIANIGSTGHIDMTEASMPLNLMNSGTPTTSMKFFYTTSSDGRSFPILPVPYRAVENCLYPSDTFAQDRHQLGVSTDTLVATEIYNNYPVGSGTAEGCPTCTAQSGVQYGPMSYKLAYGDGATDAAGMYLQPLLARYAELKSGRIEHALRFTLANGFNYKDFLWPATNFSNQCQTLSTCVPYGARFRLKAAYDDSGLLPYQKVVTAALKKYGMFMADGGQSLHIQSSADVFADTSTYHDLDAFRNSGPTLGDFEQVDESVLMISTSSGRVQIANGKKVVPNDYAVVIATKTSDSTATYTYIALQPVTVGWSNPAFPANDAALPVMAGTPAFQIPYWVNGATNTAASCTMTPTIGTLTAGCLYTAPTSVVTLSSAIITITPTQVYDPVASTTTFPIVIFSSDAIRQNIGGKAASISSPAIPYVGTDYGPGSDGGMWWSDPVGTLPPWYGLDDNSSPQSSWPSNSDIGLYYTQRHGLTDACWSAMVPNGNYTLTLKYGNSDQNQVNLSSVSVDSQSTVVFSTSTRPVSAIYSPNDKTASVQVTNNQFYFCQREIYNGNFPFLGAWKLNLDSQLSRVKESLRGNVTFRGRVTLK